MLRRILLLPLLAFCLCLVLSGQDDPQPTDFFEGVEPKPLNMDSVKRLIGYPQLAREAEIEGKVVVRVLVDQSGKYLKHIVLKDPHPILTMQVTKHLPALVFSPAMVDGEPVKVWVTIPFLFSFSGDYVSLPPAENLPPPLGFAVGRVTYSIVEPEAKPGKKPIIEPSLSSESDLLEMWNRSGKIDCDLVGDGAATLTLQIDKKGNVAQAPVWNSSYMLSNATKSYLAQSLMNANWTPAQKGRKAIASTVHVTLELRAVR